MNRAIFSAVFICAFGLGIESSATPGDLQQCDLQAVMAVADTQINDFAKSNGALTYVAGEYQQINSSTYERVTFIPFNFRGANGRLYEGYFQVDPYKCSIVDGPIFTVAGEKQVR